ncbi:MAG: hypothetical protein ACOCVJ_02500 [Verrucomicrobiota bacterium]
MTRADQVFINCPFDEAYKRSFQSILFTVSDCGFIPRTAKENDDCGTERLEFITELVKQCKYGIHDISRTELDPENNLPRFNMPFELGLFMGMGASKRTIKEALIMDVERFRFQKFISDISGRDPKAHNGKTERIVKIVRDWLGKRTDDTLPGSQKVTQRFEQFLAWLPLICEEDGHDPEDVPYDDFLQYMSAFQQEASSQ